MRKVACLVLLLSACVAEPGDDRDHRDSAGGKADDDVTEVDIYADARDVTMAVIVFPVDTISPATYARQQADGFSLGGTEFWQKWSGGKSPTFNFGDGTDAGRLCMQASAIRWATIMKEPPTDLVKVRDDSNWNGSFFNWNDDYAHEDAYGAPRGARLWAWRTGLIKWISQTGKDGSCHLPTLEMVERLATSCLARGVEIQGCSAQ